MAAPSNTDSLASGQTIGSPKTKFGNSDSVEIYLGEQKLCLKWSVLFKLRTYNSTGIAVSFTPNRTPQQNMCTSSYKLCCTCLLFGWMRTI